MKTTACTFGTNKGMTTIPHWKFHTLPGRFWIFFSVTEVSWSSLDWILPFFEKFAEESLIMVVLRSQNFYLEPVCPLFWGFNPPKEVPKSNQNKSNFGSKRIYIYIRMIMNHNKDPAIPMKQRFWCPSPLLTSNWWHPGWKFCTPNIKKIHPWKHGGPQNDGPWKAGNSLQTKYGVILGIYVKFLEDNILGCPPSQEWPQVLSCVL